MASPHPRRILFTVDVEEFDTAVEFGHDIPLSEQLAVSTRGLRGLAERFDVLNARTTLFTTANYALHEPELMRQLAADAVATLPLPKDGKDADPAVMEEMVARYVTALPVPRDGRDVDPAAVERMVSSRSGRPWRKFSARAVSTKGPRTARAAAAIRATAASKS